MCQGVVHSILSRQVNCVWPQGDPVCEPSWFVKKCPRVALEEMDSRSRGCGPGICEHLCILQRVHVEPVPVIQEEVLTERLMTIENIIPLERTVFFIGLEGIPQLWIHLTKHLDTGSPEATPRALDAELWKQRTGIDPRDPIQWSEMGLNADQGLYFARIHLTDDFSHAPQSIYFVPTTRPETILPVLERWGLSVRFESMAEHGIHHLTVQGRRFLVGQRDGYTALMPMSMEIGMTEKRRITEGYLALLKDDGPRLASADHIGAALNNQSGEFGTVGILNGVVLREQLSARGQLSEVGDALMRSAPMAGLVSGSHGSALRALALPPLEHGLTEIFGAKVSPNLARYVPRSGWVAARLSLRLDTLISGMSKSLPASMSKQKFFLMGLPTVLKLRGIPYDELLRAFDGHLLLMVPSKSFLESLREKPMFGSRFLYVASLKDPSAADVFLKTLRTKLLEGEDRTFETLSMEGATGYSGEEWADLSSDEN